MRNLQDKGNYLKFALMTKTVTLPLIDPVLHYQSVSQEGRKPHTALFTHETGNETQSYIIHQTAIKISFRQNTLSFTALTPFGNQVLQAYFQTDIRLPTITLSLKNCDPLSFSHPALDEIRRFIRFFGHRIFICIGFEFFDYIENIADIDSNTNDGSDIVCLVPEVYAKTSRVLQNTLLHAIGTEDQIEDQTKRLRSIINTLSTKIQSEKISSIAQAMTDNQDKVTVDPVDQDFCKQVDIAKKHIRQGDAFQIVLSRRFELPCKQPFASFISLIQNNPSPYTFFVHTDEGILFGASPETSVQVIQDNEKRTVRLFPIAGTKPRGKDANGIIDTALDQQREHQLLQDPKECAEHMMLVDLARNDLSKISQPGTVRVSALKHIAKYAHVMHLYSVVEGECQPRYDIFHAFCACLNMGTLSGAPKLKATQIIKSIEQRKRNMYGGAIGWVDHNNTCNTAIMIRTAQVRNGIATVQAGAGIVLDSFPQSEADETRQKANAVIEAIQSANRVVCDAK